MFVSSILVAVLVSLAAGAGEPDQRIVGGDLADPHSWPWQLSLRIIGFHICGAAIISRNFAVTAAHCVDWAPANSFYVVAGVNSLRDPADSEQTIYVEEIAIHPEWTGSPYDVFKGDIAVLKLSSSFTWTNEVQQAYIRGAKFDYAEEDSCYITGWGLPRGDAEEASEFLRETVTTVLSNEECRNDFYGPYIRDDQVCVYDKQTGGQTGACNGDSGGPLVCKRKGNGPYFLIGLTSFGVRGCLTSYPSVYTRVSSFFHWVQDTKEQMSLSTSK